ncbi:hypothetical protein [Roseomonas chloroacetimidivorans]|uniref:hypothetical protein n=1 Tax=Roseomonas chloroacetimidivorans TaxID=1766656 RepID=UPI003C72581C
MSETMGRVECLVAEDGMLSRVALCAETVLLDAAGVETLIWELAACRAAMLPKRTAFMFEGSRINLGEAVVTTHADGREVIAVMHSGLGWVGAPSDAIKGRSRPEQSVRSHLAGRGSP